MTFSFNFSTAEKSSTLLRKPSALLLLAAVVAGCSSHSGYVIGAPRSYSQKGPADIAIVDDARLGHYDVIGRVHAHSWAPGWLPWLLMSQDELIDKLLIEAALLDADAIIDINRYSRSQFEWQEEHLMGTAVTLRNRDVSDAP